MAMSSPSSSRSSTPEVETQKIKRKRKQEVLEEEVSESDSDTSDSDGEANEVDVDEEREPSENEEPVLSHKERRRKKKEEKLAAKLAAEGGSASKKQKLKDGRAKTVDASSNNKRQNSVWVGNMSFKTTQENLRSFFKTVGEITRINMPTKAPTGPGVPPENRGFAYVDFATPEAKAAAIALSEQPLVGRKLLIKDGDDFAGRPAAIAGEHAITDPALAHKTHSKTAQKILRAQKQPPAPTLFFGNLGFETTEDSIRELLEAHRPKPKKGKEAATEGDESEQKSKEVWIRKVRMGTFEDSGLCKGFAFVDFMTVEHATSALINPKNHHLNGRNLVVEYASADAVRRGAPKGSRPTDGTAGRGRGSGRGRGRGGNSSRNFDRPPRNFDAPTEEGHDARRTAEALTNDETSQVERIDRGEKKDSWNGKEGARHKGPKNRPKPGAALALAKRESAAIVPAQGHKITF